MKNSGKITEKELLRQKAEEVLKNNLSEPDSPLSAIDTEQLIHELKVHQVELELQNNELRQSESIFKDIIEKNPMSIQILNLDGQTIQTNSAHTHLFGATPPSDYSIFDDTQLLEQGF